MDTRRSVNHSATEVRPAAAPRPRRLFESCLAALVVAPAVFTAGCNSFPRSAAAPEAAQRAGGGPGSVTTDFAGSSGQAADDVRNAIPEYVKPTAPLLTDMANMETHAQQYGKAEQNLRRALKLDKNYLPAHVGLIKLYTVQQQYDKARAELDVAWAKKPDAPELLNEKAVLAAHAGDLAGAVAIMQKVVADRPTDSLYLRNLGSMQVSAGDVSGALQTFGRLGSPMDAHLLTAQALQRTQSPETAAVLHAALSTIDPNNDEAREMYAAVGGDLSEFPEVRRRPKGGPGDFRRAAMIGAKQVAGGPMIGVGGNAAEPAIDGPRAGVTHYGAPPKMPVAVAAAALPLPGATDPATAVAPTIQTVGYNAAAPTPPAAPAPAGVPAAGQPTTPPGGWFEAPPSPRGAFQSRLPPYEGMPTMTPPAQKWAR
ncbi:MAG: tetratricopeptide repeat protein [Planctomycetia bacterium]